MAITATAYTAFLNDLGLGVHNFSADTDKVALLSNSYTPNLAAHAVFADVSPAQVAGAGYTAGGVTLSNKTWSGGVLNADPVNWASISVTCRYAVIYKSTGPLIGLIDFGADRTYSAEPFQLSLVVTAPPR